MIRQGSLVVTRNTCATRPGTFWYVTGILGGKHPKQPTVYMLATSPKGEWRYLLDANEVTEADKLQETGT